MIFLCDEQIRPLLRRVCLMDMCNGDYLFIHATVEAVLDVEVPHESDDDLFKQAFKYLIVVRLIYRVGVVETISPSLYPYYYKQTIYSVYLGGSKHLYIEVQVSGKRHFL